MDGQLGGHLDSTWMTAVHQTERSDIPESYRRLYMCAYVETQACLGRSHECLQVVLCIFGSEGAPIDDLPLGKGDPQ